MNGFAEALARRQGNEEGLRSLFRPIDVQIIAEALNLTGAQSIRRRKLPTEQVVFLALGMTSFRNMPISLVASSLDLSLAGPAPSGSLCEARKRVGAEPLKYIFINAQARGLTKTAWRMVRSAMLFVGSKSETRRNVHRAGSKFKICLAIPAGFWAWLAATRLRWDATCTCNGRIFLRKRWREYRCFLN